MNIEADNFTQAITELRRHMVTEGKAVHTNTWQGRNIKADPSAQMFELMHVNVNVPLQRQESLEHWREDIKPNLPWADDHFEERVCGAPINPGVEWAHWPWGTSANTFRADEQFNHNYMERYWPKAAGHFAVPTLTAQEWHALAQDAAGGDLGAHVGLRHTYGDLNDVVSLLVKDPGTRQAYLPIFFPEDTGIGDGGRKPCTLGYQFIMRRGVLDVFYPMRSVDLIRHFQDDCYLTVRLLLWVLNECRKQDKSWNLVRPGTYVMQMTNLHCFVNDMIALRKERENA